MPGKRQEFPGIGRILLEVLCELRRVRVAQLPVEKSHNKLLYLRLHFSLPSLCLSAREFGLRVCHTLHAEPENLPYPEESGFYGALFLLHILRNVPNRVL